MIKAIAKVGLVILTPKIWCTWRNSGPRSGTWRNSILTYFSNSRSVFGQINALKFTTLIHAVKSIKHHHIVIDCPLLYMCMCSCPQSHRTFFAPSWDITLIKRLSWQKKNLWAYSMSEWLLGWDLTFISYSNITSCQAGCFDWIHWWK